MADENILAGMTPEQADADIAAREGKVEQLEATLAAARDNLDAARAERDQLERRPFDGVEVVAGLNYRAAADVSDGNGTAAQPGVAEASGKVGG